MSDDQAPRFGGAAPDPDQTPFAAGTPHPAGARPIAHVIALPSVAESAAPLPALLSSFIGREQDVATVVALLADPAVRLLTLTGPGGIGKTRLALASASAAQAHFADGVAFVALDAIHQAEQVVPAISQALGLRESTALPRRQQLQTYLRHKRLLLVLDNFEQVLAAAPEVAALLSAASTVTALITSRASLRVSGERELPLAPLTLPAEGATAAELLASEAVRLFVARAQAYAPVFTIDDEVAPVIAEICARLDGLPLAIELAAAHVKVLPPRQLAARLAQRLPLLTRGASDAPPRHGTLRDAIAWSYDLLPEAEQALFRRLAVFDGGCTLEAAEYVGREGGRFVVGGGPAGLGGEAENARTASPSSSSPLSPRERSDPPQAHRAAPPGPQGRPPKAERPSPPSAAPPSVLDLVAALIDQSLVRAVHGLSGEPRIALFETIREFGLERLVASGEADAVRDAHAHYYLALAEAAEVGLQGAEQVTWLHRLEGEHDNLRTALHWLTQRGETPPSGGGGRGGELESALRLAGALWFFRWIRGYYAESRAQFEALVGRPEAAAPTMARAKALNGLGVTALSQGDPSRAVAAHEEALSIGRQLSDSPGEAFSLVCLGAALMGQSEYRRAETVTRESLAGYRGLGDHWGAQMALSNLAFGALHRGDQQQAEELFRESLGITRALGERWATALTLDNLGWLALGRQENTRAQELFTDALAMMAELGDRRDRPDALVGLARARQRQGEVEQAITLFDESLAIARETGDQRGTAQTLYWLGHTRWRQGAPGEASALVHEAHTIYEAIGDLVYVAASLEALAILATAQGDHEHAARWMGEAQALQERLGFAIPGPDRFDAVAGETSGERSRSMMADQAATAETI